MPLSLTTKERSMLTSVLVLLLLGLLGMMVLREPPAPISDKGFSRPSSEPPADSAP